MPEDAIVVSEPGGESQQDVGSNAANRKSKNKRIAKEAQEGQDLLYILSTPQGRRIIWGLLSEANIFADPYMGAQRGEDTANRLGEQKWGRRIYAKLNKTQALRTALNDMQTEAEKHG